MRMTAAQVAAHEARISAGKNHIVESNEKVGVDRESKLHEQIIEHCNKQWPRWKYRHARMDRATTEEKGVEDFTIFMPNGKTLHVECKKRDGKLDEDQRNWQHELGRLGHAVHVVRSFEEFLALL